MPTDSQILLDHRPTHKVSPANFRIVETPVPTPGPGQVLVRHWFLSLDPGVRKVLQRRQVLRQAPGDRRGDGRGHGRRRRGLEQSPLTTSAMRSSAWVAGSAIRIKRRRKSSGGRCEDNPDPGLSRAGRHAGRDRLVWLEQDHRPGSRTKQCWCRRRPARSARWSASSPRSLARERSGSPGARKMRLRRQGTRLRRLRRP